MSTKVNVKEKIIYFDITGKCNLRCKHCYQWELFNNNGRDVFELSITEIKNTIIRLKNEGFTRLHILGGEPLLSPNLISTIKYAKDVGMQVSIVSNGTLLISKARELSESGVDLISLSFEGVSASTHDYVRGKGSYEKTMQQIKKIRSVYPKLFLAAVFTITNTNLSDVKKLPKWINKNGFVGLNIQIVGNDGNACNNQELAVDVPDALEEIEKIIPFFSKNIQLDIKCSNLVKTYFIMKYGLDMEIVDERCKGLNRQIYWSRGKLLPCNASEPYVESLNYKNQDLSDTKFKKSNNSFRGYVKNLDIYKSFSPCNHCYFFGKKCLPCPIVTGWRKQTSMLESCDWAMNKIATLRQDWKSSLIKFNAPLGQDVILRGQGLKMWRVLQKKKELLFNEVSQKFSAQEQDQIIMFWQYLLGKNKIKKISLKGGEKI